LETIEPKNTVAFLSEKLESPRLHLDPLTPGDTSFIIELLNTKEWIRFIGDRNIRSNADADLYIQKILSNSQVQYWVVRLKKEQTPIGIITFIKREYLPHPDLGFAFLPQFMHKGYALEASKLVLQHILGNRLQPTLLATTISDNVNSIRLLQKLGFEFEKAMEVENETIHLYNISIDKWNIDELIHIFFNSFTNINQQIPNLEILYSICHPGAHIIKNTVDSSTFYTVPSFIDPRQKILTDGSLVDFEEEEISAETHIVKNMAQRRSVYKKTGILNGIAFKQKGDKFFQLIKTDQSWKICSVLWEDE
jgi:RimJ/RimL family protein N-acetyltransferase